MESPVVVDKPPEYHGGDRGFPFDDEDEAWSESFSSRHPDLAARLRQRPSNWTSKRRPTSQDADDFGDRFAAFDRLNFNEIPPEFREHFPANWNRRFSSRDEPQPHPHPHPHQYQQPQPQASQSPPQQQTAATQTDHNPPEENVQTNLPQYGLRNTVDLGQKSAADPSLVDAEDRNQRSMSAPPDSRTNANMSGQSHPEHRADQKVVRQIPIVVEGRDQPVMNKFVDDSTHFADKPYQHNIDREQYFTNDGPTGIHHPPNMRNSFGTFNKPRQPTQPFTQQKMFPQSATRGASPHRGQPAHQPADANPSHDHHHQQPADNRQPPPHQQPNQPPPSSQPPPPPPPQNQAQSKPQSAANDPITQILAIQTDVLDLMTKVEDFNDTKKNKDYLYLDEMLTRNLIKLDLIETDGKENIRTARKEAIKCIQKCIAVLEAKAEKATQEAAAKEAAGGEKPNGEVDMQDVSNEPKAAPTDPLQEGNAEQTQPPAVTEAPQPEDTRTEVPKDGSKNKKPVTKKGSNARDKSKENTEQMQVEEPAQPAVEAMDQDASSQQ